MTIIKLREVEEIAILTLSKELDFSLDEEEAFRREREKGEALGYERACLEHRSFICLIQTMAQQLLEKKESLLEALRPELIRCCFAICEKMIRQELENPKCLTGLVLSLLKDFSFHTSQCPLRLDFSVEDYQILEDYFSKIESDSQQMTSIQFRADSSLRRGDFRIESESQILSYNISRELELLQERLKYGLE